MKKTLFAISTYALPMAVFAQDDTILTLVGTVGAIIAAITPIVVALALLYFFWGLAKYVLASGDEAAKETGKNIMIWGIIALFIMVSVWGVVQILADTVGVQVGDDLDSVPSVPLDSAGS